MIRPALATLIGLAVLIAPAVQAATVVESVSSANGPQTLTVTDGHVRIEPARRGAPGMLFDAERERLVLLNRPARQYNVIDAGRLAALEARVARQRERMAREIEAASGEERTRLRRRMERLPAPDGGAAIRIEVGEERTSLNGRSCSPATAHTGVEASHRLCLAPVATLGLGQARIATLGALFEFLARVRNLLGGGGSPFDARLLQTTLQSHEAFPLRIERIDDGASWTVRSIDERERADDFFNVPADYTEGARLGAG